ncbi:hypothetical protein BLNAU_19886 [Blattamonas nauphoetae]|nr:hypothetical protein BLNAU_19886 [Blattamonas nauphoetae]
MLNSSGAESPLSQSASLTSPTPSSQELFGDSLFLPFLLSPLLHYLHAVLSVSLLHPLGPNEHSLIEQFVDEDGVIILHRLYCIVFSPLLVGYLDVLTQRQTNSDILKTPFSQQFLTSFTSTLFHFLSIIMLSYENLTKQPTLVLEGIQIGRPAEEGIQVQV